jgi:four helix bundle protein
MTKNEKPKQYDLEERAFEFARCGVEFCRGLPKTTTDGEIAKQLVRAATPVGANYIEANEALSKKDFLMRIKIYRKEAKETGYWLRLIRVRSPDLTDERERLIGESVELMKIFGSILTRSQ